MTETSKSTNPRIIKRYANRKLYDTETSTYITLSEIADLVRDGIEIRVVDHKTGEDITSVIFAQILVEEGKREKSRFSSQALRALISQGEEALGLIKERLSSMRTEAEKRKERIERVLSGKVGSVEDLRKTFRELFVSMQNSFAEWQSQVDNKLDYIRSKLAVLSQLGAEVNKLTSKLGQFEERLDSLERLVKRDSKKKTKTKSE